MASTSGSFSAVDQQSAVVIAHKGERITATVSGTWVGQVALQKMQGSAAGENKHLFNGNGSFDITEPGQYRLFSTRYTSGTISYSLSTAVPSDQIEGSDAVTSITYDGSDRVSTYVKNGITYTATYYSEGNGTGQIATLTGGGVTRTYTYNASGLLTDEVIS